MNTSFVSVGIDISKAMLDTHILGRPTPDRVPNDSQGIARLVDRLKERKPSLIVCEPSGGYERPLLTALRTAGLRVALVNPRQARDFARAKGILAKTDAIDARVLAEYGAAIRPSPKDVGKHARLAEFFSRRNHLIGAINHERQQREHLTVDALRQDSKQHCAWLRKRLAAVDAAIRALIAADPMLKRQHAILTSCKGIGDVTATVLMTHMPELGTASPAQIAALAGVAPFNRDSGAMRGKRSISGGKKSVRCVLYMATVVAVQHNPDIRRCYERLRAKGKLAKVAIVACMRKLLIVLNSLVRDGRTWTPQYSHPQAAS